MKQEFLKKILLFIKNVTRTADGFHLEVGECSNSHFDLSVLFLVTLTLFSPKFLNSGINASAPLTGQIRAFVPQEFP
jgi:hypothetical protein